MIDVLGLPLSLYEAPRLCAAFNSIPPLMKRPASARGQDPTHIHKALIAVDLLSIPNIKRQSSTDMDGKMMIRL